MPEDDARVLDIRTSRVAERIAAVDDFVEAGYEVHLNLSPVVLREGWAADWAQLLRRLDDELSPTAKAQAAAEVILLTHNRDLHQVNLGWHPKAEELLWRPDLQQPKRSQNGSWNVRYRNDVKRAGVARVQELVAAHAPWLRIRYSLLSATAPVPGRRVDTPCSVADTTCATLGGNPGLEVRGWRSTTRPR